MKYRKIYYGFSGLLVTLSILSLFTFGLPLGIDFTGGSFMELKFISTSDESVNIPERSAVIDAVEKLEVGTVTIQSSANNILLLRFADVDEVKHQAIIRQIESVSENEFIELRFDSVGPVIGAETVSKSLWAIGLVLVMIVIYVAWAFRKISYPIGSLKYGLVAIAALFHDIIITVGIFSVISHFNGSEVGVAFVAALLTILGYSVNDTIVIFDRIRENLRKLSSSITFEQIVSRSVAESLVRSLNSSLTTIFVLAAILIYGGATIHNFVLILIIGIAIGTYSSIAFASPLLVSWSHSKITK